MQLSGAHGRVRSTGALLLPLEAVVSGEPARTPPVDDVPPRWSAGPVTPASAATDPVVDVPLIAPARRSNSRKQSRVVLSPRVTTAIPRAEPTQGHRLTVWAARTRLAGRPREGSPCAT